MKFTKFIMGQKIKHNLLGYLGIIIDIDQEYSLKKSYINDIIYNDLMFKTPWYHIIMEDYEGKNIQTYLSELQITYETFNIDDENIILDDLSQSILIQFETHRLKN